MNNKALLGLCKNNFMFWLSRMIDYPLVPPDMVQVNFTFQCNLSCKMCSMHEQKMFLQGQGRRTEIETEDFKKIINDTARLGTKTILFIGGEPLLRKDLFDLTKYAQNKGLSCVVVTNALLLSEENISKCIDARVNWLSISIDAASETTFAKIRGDGVFDKVVNNIKLLNKIKKERKADFPKLGVVCTIMDDNLEELLDVVRLCQRLEVDKIIFQPVVFNNADQSNRDNASVFLNTERIPVLNNVIDRLIAYKKSSPQNFYFITNSFRHLQLIKRYFQDPLETEKWPCYAGYNRLQIAQDYRVYFCIPPHKTIDASFGDVGMNSLSELWYSKEAKTRRKLIKRCNIPCLQWCSYREDFIVLAGILQKFYLFKIKKADSHAVPLEKKT